jgi:N,N'-diacetyllegionaminate synthase
VSGLSDHTGNLSTSIYALTKNASIIEIHVCYDKIKDVGPDVSSSLDFKELSILSKIRDDFEILKKNYQSKKKLTVKQKKLKKIFTKSLSLKKDLQKGKTLKKTNLTLKKPGNGLKIKDINKIIGKKAKKNLSRFNIIKLKNFI